MDLLQRLFGGAAAPRNSQAASGESRRIVLEVPIRPPRHAPPATRSSTGLDATSVVPIPRLDWPAVPDAPRGLDGLLETYVAIEDRPYNRTTCPNCEAELSPLPKATKRCPFCRGEMLVRTSPDGVRYILSPRDAEGFEQRWADFHAARLAEDERLRREARREWHQRLAAVGVAVGSGSLDLAGAAEHLRELAGVMLALRTRDDEAEVKAIAEVVRDEMHGPDDHAVKVVIHRQPVGHLARWQAEEMQPLLREFESTGRRYLALASIVGGRTQDDGTVGRIGVVLEECLTPWARDAEDGD